MFEKKYAVQNYRKISTLSARCNQSMQKLRNEVIQIFDFLAPEDEQQSTKLKCIGSIKCNTL